MRVNSKTKRQIPKGSYCIASSSSVDLIIASSFKMCPFFICPEYETYCYCKLKERSVTSEKICNIKTKTP